MKFFSGISSVASLLIQVILVVAAVLVFAYFDPFGILSPTKKKLKDTPIQVRSIKQIGQLISAEYYGEVITSLEEVIDADLDSVISEYNFEIEALHVDFLTAIDSIASKDLRRRDIYKYFLDMYPGIPEDENFGQYAYFIYEKLKDRRYNKRELDKTLEGNDLKKFIENIGLQRKDEVRELLHEISLADIQVRFKQVETARADKEIKNRRLVLLGRGWVKAGFDFQNFTERNFIYDAKQKKAAFIGLNPEILSATINPWFIPEEGVEGFEFIMVERRVKHDPELTIKVKQRCLDKLLNQAMEKQILLQAQNNAEQYLSHFIEILVDDPEFRGVYFFSDYLDYSLNTILQDRVIQNEELYSIDTILSTSMLRESYSRDAYRAFFDSLTHAGITTKIYGIPIQLNSKSSSLFRMVHDGRITHEDTLNHLNDLEKITALDSLWIDAQSDSENMEIYYNNVVSDFKKDLDTLIATFQLE